MNKPSMLRPFLFRGKCENTHTNNTLNQNVEVPVLIPQGKIIYDINSLLPYKVAIVLRIQEAGKDSRWCFPQTQAEEHTKMQKILDL